MDLVTELRDLYDAYNRGDLSKWRFETITKKAATRIEDLEFALKEFCRRVDAGEIRSKRTYEKFKSLLNG